MKKIILMVATAVAVMGSSVGTGLIGEDGSTMVFHGNDSTIIYNRPSLEVKHQKPANDAFIVQKKICDIPRIAGKIKSEPVTFVYVYSDGAMVIRIDDCDF